MADDRIRVVIDADASDLERELRKAGAGVSTFGRQVSGQSRGMLAFNAAADKQRQTLREVGRAAVVGGTAVAAGAALAAAHIVKTGMAYEQEMSRVDGVVDGTAKQMSRLNQIALRLGAETKFSASEAAEGMYELGSAGFSANQMGKALEGTLSLAAASNIELADAADIAAAAVKGFQLNANQTTHVADVLAMSANTTALQMGDLQLSMKYIAPIAVTTGQSFETMTAALGIMGDAGIRGEQAGTTLRAGLLRLVKPTSMVEDGLAKLGLSAKELYGPDGLLPMPELVDKLSEGMEGLSQSQKSAALAGIFGQEAVSGMLTIIDAGPEKLRSLTREFENSAGASKAASKIMQDNVAGAWEQVTGSIESLEIAIYQQFEEPMKDALLEVSAALDREGPQIQEAFQDAMATPEFEDGDLADQIRILGRVAQDEWKRLGLGDDLQQIFSDAVSAAIPVVAEGSARLGLAAAKGLINGFIDADVWGRLLIGTWLFTKLGGFAAIRAAGTQAGTQVAAGTAAGMTAGQGAIGAAAVGWTTKIKGILTSAGWAAAAMISIQAGTDALKLFEPSADDAMDRLDQIAAKGDTVQAKMGSMFDLIPSEVRLPFGLQGGKTLSDLLGLGDLDDAGESAKRLQSILGEVNSVNAKRNAQLRAEGLQLIENLDLTREQRDEFTKILNLKPEAASNVQAGIDKLASGMITRMQDITKQARENSRAAADAYGEDTPLWRSAMARNMNATVAAIRAGMKDGVIETDKGKKKIRALLARRDLITGADVGGIVQGFKKTWVRTGEINREGIKSIIKDLDKMPPAARKRAARMMVEMAESMEKSGKLPKGAASKLRSALVTEFNIAASEGAAKIKKLQDAAGEGGRAWGRSLDGFGKDTKKGMDLTSRELDRGKKKVDSVFDALDKRAGKWRRDFPREVDKVNPPVEGAIREMYSTMNKGLVPLGVEPVKFGVAKGGKARGYAGGGMMRVAGQGLYDSVPLSRADIAAMVAPGEDLIVANRHQRPLLDAAVANTYGVDGLGGFFGTYDKPHHYAQGGIVALGRQLQSEGYEVGEHPAFGGVDPVHTEGSYHYSGQALDVNDDAAPFAYGGSEGASLDRLYARLQKMPGVIELLWQVADHYDHLHVAMGDGASGALAGGLKLPDPLKRMLFTGPDGPLTDMGQAILDKVREAANSHLESAVDSMTEDFGPPTFGSANWKNELHKIAEAKGWSASAWMELVMRESGGDPTAVNPSSGAFGLGQFLGSTADAYAKYGAKSSDPVKQIQAMAKYIADRYGSPSAALDFHSSHNWYSAGGTISGSGARSGPSGGARPGKTTSQKIKEIEKQLKEGKGPDGKKLSRDDREQLEKTKARLEKRENREERKQKREERKRKRARRTRLGKLHSKGIPSKMLAKDGSFVDRIEGLRDEIDQAEMKMGWADSPGGEEETQEEIDGIIALLQQELGQLYGRRDLLKNRIREPLKQRLVELGKEIKAATPRKIKKEGKRVWQKGRWVKRKGKKVWQKGRWVKEKDKWVDNPLHRNLNALKINRTNVREGIEDATDNIRDVAGHNELEGGQILQVSNSLQDYGAWVPKAPDTEPDADTDSALIDLLREQLLSSQRTAALSEGQFGVFQQFLSGLGPGMPYIGAYAMGTGGRRVGRTGLAVLHEDEIVTPDPKGGYGRFASDSPAAGGSPQVTLVLSDKAGQLIQLVDARIDGKTARIEQKVDRTIGRKQRQLSVAPGR